MRPFFLLCVTGALVLTISASGVSAGASSGVSGSDTIRRIAGVDAAVARDFRAGTLTVDREGNVFFYDDTALVRKLSSCGALTTFAGTRRNPNGPLADGPAASANLAWIERLASDAAANLYLAQRARMVVRKVTPGGLVTTFAGTDGPERSTGDGGPATEADLGGPSAVAADAQGNVYIAELSGLRVRKVSPNGTISAFAGSGSYGFSGDGGPAVSARLSFGGEGALIDVATDGRGNVYIVDGVRVRKIDTAGRITTYAGTGKQGLAGDGGPATKAQLLAPVGIAADKEGDLYIADGDRVRKVSLNGTITTVAGTGKPGFAGEGGPARKSQLWTPRDVAVDPAGNLYISDGSRLLEVTRTPLPAAGPRLQLKGAPTQRLTAQRGITVTAGCDRPSSLSASGSVKILGTSNVFQLTPATATLATAGSKRLTLRLPAAARRRFNLLLKPGQRAQATIMVRSRDRAGRTCTSAWVVTVRR